MSTTFTGYHGTSGQLGVSIANSGFQLGTSEEKRLGPNKVYLTDSLEAAKAVAQHRSTNGVAVLKVTVTAPGGVHDLGTASDMCGAWVKSSGKQVAKSVHPAWLGVPAFTEYAVNNPSCIRVEELLLIGGHYGNITNPNIHLRLSGGATAGAVGGRTLTFE